MKQVHLHQLRALKLLFPLTLITGWIAHLQKR